MLKGGTNQHDFVLVEIYFSFNLNNFHSLEVVDRVSETQAVCINYSVVTKIKYFLFNIKLIKNQLLMLSYSNKLNSETSIFP